MIFVDGVGIGNRGPHNPLDGIESPFFSIFHAEEPRLPFDGRIAVTDATLGIAGLPQSATGQTAILTGINAAALIGRHLHGYPSPRLKAALAERSIYKRLMEAGLNVTFANAYRPAFFTSRPRFVSATTVAAESAGLRLRTFEDLKEERAVYHDFTNRLLGHTRGDVATISPADAGRTLASLASQHDFTLYEHFITDRIGHEQEYELARLHVGELTDFVTSVLESVDLEKVTVLMTSDHGNLEDLSTRSHTLNPVATLAFGPGRNVVADRVRSLTDVTDAIASVLA